MTSACLVFSKSAGFRHESIPAGIAAIQQLGVNHDFNVTATEDASQFNAANLDLFDAVIFLQTTGDVLNSAQEAALQSYIRAGGGFAGVHAASDTEYGWPWYGQLIGAYFSSHPAIQTGTDCWRLTARIHPRGHFPSGGRARMNGITSRRTLAETCMCSRRWTKPPTPAARWVQIIRSHGAMTSTADDPGTPRSATRGSYSDPLFLEHLLGGIEWAAGHARGRLPAGR